MKLQILKICAIFHLLAFEHAIAETIQTIRFDPKTGDEQVISVHLPSDSEIPNIPAQTKSRPLKITSLGSEKLPYALQERLAAAKPIVAPYASALSDVPTSEFEKYGLIGGTDERQLVSSTSQFPASAITKILYKNTKGYESLCTGAMISPNAVLTAGHCVYSLGWHSSFVVVPGNNGELQPFGICGVDAVYIFSAWKDINQDFDLAILELDCEAGKKTGFFALETFGSQNVGRIARLQGYPAESAMRGKQYFALGQLTRARQYLVDHQIDSTPGMSGSPLWLEKDYAIFAVHTFPTPPAQWMPDNPHAAEINHATRLTKKRIAIIAEWLK